MVKGFIDYSGEKVPFVIDNCRMELFTDGDILKNFAKEYNFKKNYILHGQCFSTGIQGQTATFLVDYSLGSTCYLRCYIVNTINAKGKYSTIGFQSPFLDDIFRYKHKYLELARKGINLALTPQVVYTIPFTMNDNQYKLKYRIGQDNRLGLLEDFDKKGEIRISLRTDTIQECYDLSVVLYRLAMFIMSTPDVPFYRVKLYENDEIRLAEGQFFCAMVSEKAVSWADAFFGRFDTMKYVPKIINNIALDSGNRITKSIPLGHLASNENLFSPQRFLQQVMSFEYLYDKVNHKKARNQHFPLKNKLQFMLEQFPHLLLKSGLSTEKASVMIKKLRNQITHGDTYYYDFKNDRTAQHLMIILDNLIRNMSLLLIGFSKDEIECFLDF